ncbi:MAG: winged helix-turn-helix transcriptional regulator [Burkholderiaceae bacterium]|nr:winged helix-turn-helix transcriptional regulator [Microbacteriaceae bacterium]
MVVHKASEAEKDLIFHALADATRRDIVGRVIEREQSISSLAQRYAVSFAAVQKQVAVLERASLVHKVRHGREQVVHVNHSTIQRAADLLHTFEVLWEKRMIRIEEILAEDILADEAKGRF